MAAAQFSVSGKITNQQTGEALPGATISLSNPATNTVADAGGRYHFDNLKGGTYTVKVSFIGYRTISKNVVAGCSAKSLTTFAFTSIFFVVA
ncbi:MAG: carboxypeptidase-like regulatory domain-containing protein [Mucilaginibacter sp.]